MLACTTPTLVPQRLPQIALCRRAVHAQHNAAAALRLLLCVGEPRCQRALLRHLLCVAPSHMLSECWVRRACRHRAVRSEPIGGNMVI